jgi:hypothetical protein
MAIVLANPTDELIKGQYDGETHYFPPYPEEGYKKRANDKLAKHLLHHYYDRGLCRLDYGDEPREEEIYEEGRARWREFKLRQISNFNRDNMQRQQTKLPMHRPDANLVKWGLELGETIFTGVPQSENEAEKQHTKLYRENERLKQENAGLKSKVDGLDAKMDLLLKRMDATATVNAETQLADEKKKIEEAKALNIHRETFKNMKKPQFVAWVKSSKTDIENLPIQIQEEVQAKWKRMEDTPFPY